MQNFYQNKKFLFFFFGVLGFFTFPPIFVSIDHIFNLQINNIFFVKKLIEKETFIYPPITISFGNTMPLGFFSIFFLNIYILYNLNNHKKKILFFILISISFVFFILIDLGVYRALSFCFSFLFLTTAIFSLNYVNFENKKLIINIETYLKFYVLSIILFTFLNLISIIYVEIFYYENIKNFPPLRFHQIFLFEIYQYYVSYSAVLSLISCVSIILLLNTDSYNKILIILLSLTLISINLTLRKMALLDLILLFVLIIFFSKNFINKNKRKFFLIIILLIIVIMIFSFNLISIRQINSLSSVFVDRIYVYLIFFSEINYLKINELLFGFSEGFGGYSNIFLDLFARIGFAGITFLIILFSIIFYLISLNKKSLEDNIKSSNNKKLFTSNFFIIAYFF